MKIGVCLLNFGSTVNFETIRRAAVLADQLHYDSIWVTDHLLVPKANVDPYGTILEPLITLAMLAELAPRAQLGTSVLVLPMRNPVLVAKQVATLDAATNGRVILGVGVGWNEPEYMNLGAGFKNRGKRLDEDIVLLRALWASEEVSFHGKYTEIPDGYSSPLPANKSVPIWIGGNREPSWRRAAKLGDGWHPNGASPEQVVEGMKQIEELKPARPVTISLRMSVDFRPETPSTFEYRGNTRYRIVGDPPAVRARIEEYAQAGVEHLILLFPFEELSVGLAQMERFASEVRSKL